jgi:hypothetical protein
MKLFFFVIFMAGIGNTVLRPEMENPLTLYRLLAPVGLITVLSLRPKLVLKGLAWFGVFVLYNFSLAMVYSSDYSQLLPSLVHYLYLFILLILMIHMKFNSGGFNRSFFKFVQSFYVFLLANLAVEVFIGSYYPNLYVDTTDESAVRAFFWNQNDLAVVLCVIGWMALTLDRFKVSVRLSVVAATLAILYYNDSKAAMLSFALISIPVFFIFRLCSIRRIAPAVWFFSIGTLVTTLIVLLLSVSDQDIRFANDTYTLDDLLFRPILNIVTLQSSGEEWGSINNRTDAAIFVTIEYLRSFGFGLGAGGSWLVLTLPQYELGGAKSPHNALLQFIVDFGYPVLLGYTALIVWALRRLFRYRLGEAERLKVMAILSFPLLGLSQSGAIVTNYFFWGCVYFIVLFVKNRTAVDAKTIPYELKSSQTRPRGLTSPTPRTTV